MREKRKDIIILQNLGILLVVLGHSYPVKSFPPVYYWLDKWIYSFHMPLFMFMSGYLFSLTNYDVRQIDSKPFIVKKIKRILVPYLFLSTLAFGPKVLLSRFAERPISFNLSTYLHGIFYPWDNPIMLFWFLPTLFIIFIIVLLIFRLPVNWQNSAVISVATAIICAISLISPLKNIEILNLSGVVSMFIFFWLGTVLSIYRHTLEGYFEKGFMLPLSFLLTLVLAGFTDEGSMRFIGAVTGIIAALSFAKVYVKYDFKFLSPLDGYYYQIFLLSWFFQMAARIVCHNLLHWGFYPSGLAMLAAGLIFPIMAARVIKERFPSGRVLVGL